MDPSEFGLELVLFAVPTVIAVVTYGKIRRFLLAAETLADDLNVLLSEGDDRRVDSRLEEVGGVMASEARKRIDEGRKGTVPTEAALQTDVRARMLPAQDGILLCFAMMSFGLVFLDFDFPRSWTVFLSAEIPSLAGFLLVRGTGDRAVARIARALRNVAQAAGQGRR